MHRLNDVSASASLHHLHVRTTKAVEHFEHVGPHGSAVISFHSSSARSLLLQIRLFTSSLCRGGTPEEKKTILDGWIQTPGAPSTVATTALAEGFDYPHVRLVMNIDEPESLVILAQESGRAGRDGKRAYSMVLLPETWQPKAMDADSLDSRNASNYREDGSLRKRQDKQAVQKYLQSEQCYRTSLNHYLDISRHRRWCIPEDKACDICKVAHRDPIDPVERVQQDKSHTGLEVIQQERLRAQTELAQYRLDLASVSGTYLLCRAVR